MNPRHVFLIVDDDDNDTLLLSHTLRRVAPDAMVQTASNGQQAIDYLRGAGHYGDRKQFPVPTVMLLDLRMPVLDGFAVLQYIKEHPEYSIIPTVVYTGNGHPGDILKAYRLGANACHIKPNDPADRDRFCELLLAYWKTAALPQNDKKVFSAPERIPLC